MTPGTCSHLLYAHPIPVGESLYPDHPVNNLRRLEIMKTMPQFRSQSVTIRAFPEGALVKPFLGSWPDPPYRYESLSPDPRRLNVALSVQLGKKSVHKSAVIRSKISTKLKTAISLIVTRGANV